MSQAVGQSAAQTAGQTLSPEDIKVLETLRIRLAPLVRNLELLQQEVGATQDGLPTWPSLQKSSSILNQTLSSLLSVLTSNADILTTLTPYPTSAFPAGQHWGILDALLQKKHLPDVDKWINDRLRKAGEFCAGAEEFVDLSGGKKKDDKDEEGVKGKEEIEGVKRMKGTLNEEEIYYLWENAGTWGVDVIQKSLQEMGYGKSPGEEEGEESDVKDEEMKDVEGVKEMGKKELEAPMMPLGTVLKFMSTGTMP
ncbi:hypothetical protein K469DRAFT_716753 [Zopfia rhizophila CBS 207.26]|uniref:Mediator of RNA polymerase II transcription subunit 8 n=1 Tax=Zopfia rhizophila CBS 207.26 TaxID=1314779 RepID=A0A6A6EMR5_9PEZI|nr:hypothetical protein K469DRAFT_716753 [Zopfia rhizophila CBS 207.26]